MHENGNVRRQANIDLAVVCSVADAQDPGLHQFGPLFKDTVADSHASVQMVALDALNAYLNHVDSNEALRYAAEICDAIVANCLTGGPEMVEKSQAVFMHWVELGVMEVFLDAMEKAIKNKVHKSVVPLIDTTRKALRTFGVMKVPPKRILKMLAELFDLEDVNVCASSKVLTLELYGAIEPMKPRLHGAIPNAMEKELDEELVSLTGTLGPSHKIRFEEDKELEQEILSEVEGSCSKESASYAPPEIDDTVDIVDTLKNTGFWDGVKSAECSKRKAAVAELAKLALTKRIAPGDFTEICLTLKQLITDVNVAVAVEAIQAIGNLAGGLRNQFSKNSLLLVPVLLEKLIEEKSSLTTALKQTLQTMHKSECLNLAHICEEPSDAAFSALPVVIKLVGMSPSDELFDILDDDRRKRLSEMFWSGITILTVRSVLQDLKLSKCFSVEEGSGNIFDGFHIRSNHQCIPKKPVSFNICTRGEGAQIAKFLNDSGELVGSYDFILEETHLSILIVPKIPSMSVMEEIKTWHERDIFMLDPSGKKATAIAPKFKILLRKFRSPMHKVFSKYGRYHGNILEGMRVTHSGEVHLCLPKQNYDSANGMLKDIRELREVIMRVIKSCQRRFTSPKDFPEDLNCFFYICDLLESEISGRANLDPEVVWDYAYYILHCPIFMVNECICNFFHKLWSMRGQDVTAFDAMLDVDVPNWMHRFNANSLLRPAVSWMRGASTSTTTPTPSQGTTSFVSPFGMPSARPFPTAMSVCAKSLTQPAPTLQQPSSTTLTTSTSALVPPRPIPTLQQPSSTTLSASASVFVPSRLIAPPKLPTSTTLTASVGVPAPTLRQPSLSASAIAFVPLQPKSPLQLPPSTTLTASARLFVPSQPTPPLQPPSSAQTLIHSQGLWFLKASRNTLTHHYQNVWKANKSVGEDELDAVALIQAAVPEGVPLLYKWMVEKVRGPTPTTLTLFLYPLRYVLNSAPYNLCASCAQQWE